MALEISDENSVFTLSYDFAAPFQIRSQVHEAGGFGRRGVDRGSPDVARSEDAGGVEANTPEIRPWAHDPATAPLRPRFHPPNWLLYSGINITILIENGRTFTLHTPTLCDRGGAPKVLEHCLAEHEQEPPYNSDIHSNRSSATVSLSARELGDLEEDLT